MILVSKLVSKPLLQRLAVVGAGHHSAFAKAAHPLLFSALKPSSHCRSFSEAAVKNVSADSDDDADADTGELAEEGFVRKRKSPVGTEFHAMLYRSRGANRLALGDFKKLCLMISDPLDVKYAKIAAELYQKKGQDFSEETNSIFIAACIRGGAPDVVVEHFAKSKHRLGAWTSNTSFNRLLGALLEQETIPECFPEVLILLRRKGLFINDVTVALLQQLVEKHDTEELKTAVQAVTAQ